MADEPETYEHTRDSVLYLIDASQSMSDSGALKSALFLVSEAIRDSARQGFHQYDAGVIVYNVQHSQTNCKTLLSLKEPTIDDLKSFIRIATDENSFKTEIVPVADSANDDNDNALLNVLRLTNAELNRLHTRSMRRVIIITNNDDPFKGDEQKHRIAMSLTSDVTNSPALIEPIFISSTEFNPSKFWATLHYLPPFYDKSYEEFDGKFPTNMQPVTIEHLGSNKQSSLVLSKSRRKYIAFRAQFRIHGLTLGVRGYNIVQPRPRIPTGREVAMVQDESGKEHRELLVSERKHAFADSGKEVDLEEEPSKIRAFQLSGANPSTNWRVPVSADKLGQLNSVESSETMYLEAESFLPAATAETVLRSSGTVGHSTLLVPNDELFVNSQRAFASLHRSMKRKHLAVVLSMHFPQSRKRIAVRGIAFAANPSAKLFEQEKPLQPGTDTGLYFVPLPFIDETRSVPEPESYVDHHNSSEKLPKPLKTLCHKFRLPTGFDPYRFPHPLTAQFSEVLEHHALSIPLETHKVEGFSSEVPVEQPDLTRPRYAKIERGLRETLEKVRYLGTIAENDIMRGGGGTKRRGDSAASSSTAAAPTRKRHVLEAPLSDEFLKECYEKRELELFTIDRIMQVAEYIGKPLNRGKKSTMLETFLPHLSQYLSDKGLLQFNVDRNNGKWSIKSEL